MPAAREGPGVSTAAIARRAGVGQATLSRRFTDPGRLISAVPDAPAPLPGAPAPAALDRAMTRLGRADSVCPGCR
ncbi:TetR family transcriptional regulator [Streptomyces nitrosporeus]|uniref:TetR family transcriptional regulator n=1 Tax=Streptomyces nitrosporeus TaxID=28894 RepID=UPI0033300BB2